jgi:hypothetical protein
MEWRTQKALTGFTFGNYSSSSSSGVFAAAEDILSHCSKISPTFSLGPLSCSAGAMVLLSLWAPRSAVRTVLGALGVTCTTGAATVLVYTPWRRRVLGQQPPAVLASSESVSAWW